MHNSGNGIDLHKKLSGKNFMLDIYDYLFNRINFVIMYSKIQNYY